MRVTVVLFKMESDNEPMGGSSQGQQVDRCEQRAWEQFF